MAKQYLIKTYRLISVARMLKGQLLAIILYMACLTGLSEQASLTCDGGDVPRLSMSDVRVAGRLDDRILLGSAQDVTVFDGESFTTTNLGVCYGTGSSNCYKAQIDAANCDNFIRAVVDLDQSCGSGCRRSLVCGTNAKLSQCANCNLNGSELSCDFTENDPPQDLPYDGSSSYTSCSSANEVGTEVFQYLKNHNATFRYYDNFIYYGLVKSDADQKSIIGKADGNRGNKVITRTDSDKMVATEAHFVGKPFVNGDYVYFLFREPAQEFASLSAGQDPSINTYYSRIARICKDDVGVSVSSTQTLTSFLKQRLVCSITTEDSEDTFYYNDIQDFALSEDRKVIHAIFTNERNAAPQSALCNFSLTLIDETFTTSDFFGADGVSNTNDLWRVYDGTAKSPRPGLNCNNPNTADTDFERDYNLMNDHAVGTVQFFLVGDRFSNLKMTSESSTEIYIISSERGCLYKAEVGTPKGDLGDPCQDPVVSSPIKDLELTENGFLVTTDDDVYVLSNCIEPTPPPPPPPLISEFPQGGTYWVPPNSVFEIIYGTMENGEASIIYNRTEITDSNDEAYRLLKNESLDCTRSLVHLSILILDDTNVTFTASNLNYSIKPYDTYTKDETMQRCEDWEDADKVYSHLMEEATCDNGGSFSSKILLENNQVQNCDNCAYKDCTDSNNRNSRCSR